MKLYIRIDTAYYQNCDNRLHICLNDICDNAVKLL